MSYHTHTQLAAQPETAHTMTRMLHVASERSSSGWSRLKRTLILPSVMGALVPLASSIISVKQLYTCRCPGGIAAIG
eukprot:scaffold11509_cov23-Tisochrysis_lutea.AAC.2